MLLNTPLLFQFGCIMDSTLVVHAGDDFLFEGSMIRNSHVDHGESEDETGNEKDPGGQEDIEIG